jgi:Flp pilus assembly protein TadD
VRTQRQTAISLVLVAGASFIAYSNSLQGDFVYDDVFFIKEHPLIRDLSNVPTLFASAFWEATSLPSKAFYRPLTVLSYALNFSVGGYEPFGYHLVNVLLHTANALLVFALVRFLSARTLFSAGIALLFGLHSINTEGVAWISGRGDLLASFFFLGTLVSYVHMYPPAASRDPSPKGSRMGWGTCLIGFALGVFAKESAATALGVLVLYELSLGSPGKRKAVRLVPFVAVLVGYLVIRLAVLGGLQTTGISYVANPLIDASPTERIFTGVHIFALYLRLLLVPDRLAVDYSYDTIPIVQTPWEAGVLAGVFAVAALLAVWAASWRRDRLVFFGIGFFLVTGGLIFSNALFPFTSIFGERFMYLPSIGFVLAVGQLARRAFEPFGARGRTALIALAFGVLATMGARTWSRNTDWHDEFALFESAARVNARSVLVQAQLGNLHYRRGRYPEARAAYEKALEIHPEFADGHAGLGNVALAAQDYPNALEHLSRAARMDPDDDEIHVLLGVTYWGLGRLDDAERETEAALRLNPNNSQTYNNLGNIRLLRGNLEGALSSWERAVHLDPFNPEALYNLASAYERAGDPARARAHYERFVEAAPPRMETLRNEVQGRLRGRIE